MLLQPLKEKALMPPQLKEEALPEKLTHGKDLHLPHTDLVLTLQLFPKTALQMQPHKPDIVPQGQHPKTVLQVPPHKPEATVM